MGFPVPVTGTFGEQTKDAVIKFQHKYGLSADGSVGPLYAEKIGNRLNFGLGIGDFGLYFCFPTLLALPQ